MPHKLNWWMVEFLPIVLIIICLALITTGYFLAIGPSLLLLSMAGVCWLRNIGATWLGIILFLMYVGGMLVLFTYFISLSSDSPIQNSYYVIPAIRLVSILPHGHFPAYIYEPVIVVNNTSIGCYVLRGLWLFFAIVIVVKLTTPIGGPLRRF